MEYFFLSVLSSIVIYLIFVRIAVRPAIKRGKETIQQKEKMINNLRLGDKVITAGGIIGRIKDINDTTFIIESNDLSFEILQSYIIGIAEKTAF